jgi:RecA/RadA recombinase
MVDVIKDEDQNMNEEGSKILENYTPEATKEMLESVKLKDDNVDDFKIDKETVKILDPNVVEDDELTKQLYAEFSSFLETKAEMIPDEGIKETIPTGIDLVDAILGGGFAIGGLNIVVGQPGSGKTMLAIKTLGEGQKKYRGKLLGGFLDSEEATTAERLAMLGVRYPMLEPYNDITIEKVFKFLEGLSLFKQTKKMTDIPSVVIWDSIANTLSQKEREADDVNSVIGYKARMLSLLIPKYVAKCAQNNICFIAVNQLRDKMQMGQFSPAADLKFMSSTKDMPGGQVLKFNAFHLIEMKVKSVIDRDKMGFDGVLVKLKCVKNKLFTPNIEVEIVGSFNSGFSNFWTNYNFMNLTNRLKTGAWNYLVSLPDKKFRTKDAYTLYKEDEVFQKAYDESSKEAIQSEIIDKYSQEV